MGLRYVGANATTDPDIVYRDYVELVKDADLSTEEIDAAINAGLGSYATDSYVATRDALLSTQAYIDAQDALRVRLSSRNVNNGLAGLDATGKIDASRIDLPNTQLYSRGPWSPGNYGAAVSVTTTETTVYQCPVTDPGYPYKLIVFGQVDAHSHLGTEYPIINVRVGNETSGEVVARGAGAFDGAENAADLISYFPNYPRSPGSMGEKWNFKRLTGSGLSGYGLDQGFFAPMYAYWLDDGFADSEVMYRKLDGDNDRVTATDFQRVKVLIQAAGETARGGGTQYVRINGRINDNESNWVAFEVGETQTRLMYSVNNVVNQLGSAVANAQGGGGVEYDARFGTTDLPTVNKRQFRLYKNNAHVLTVDDTQNVTVVGQGNRGWGFGGKAATRDTNAGQTSPPTLTSVSIGDPGLQMHPISIIPNSPNTATVRTGASNLWVRLLRSGSSSAQTYLPTMPKLYVMAVPA